MDNKDTSAFPIDTRREYEGEEFGMAHKGLTKREYTAIMAMQGLIPIFNGEHTPELCKRSIQAADELLKQLNEK